jgi:hypothetical protein
MGTLSKEAILSASDIDYEVVDVPEWGGKVRIKTLTGDERDAYEQSLIDQRGNVLGPKLAGAQARLVALTAVDDEGNRLFADSDVKALGAKSAQALNRVFEVSMRLSRLTQQDVEELVGNSNGTQAESSTATSL